MTSRNARILVAAVIALASVIVAEDVRARASQLYRERDFQQAAGLFEKVVAANPGDLQARLLLGLSRQQAGEREAAEAVFAETVRLWPKQANARYFLARIRYLRGRLEQAEADLMAARALGEAEARVLVLLGLIRSEQARYPEALANFEKASSLSGPQDPEPWIQRATLLRKLGRASEAIRVLEDASSHGVKAVQLDTLLAAARSETPKDPQQQANPQDGIRFREIAAAAGIDFVLENSASGKKYLVETMAGGVAAFDFDNDGWVDIFFTNGASLPGLEKDDPKYRNRLYRNTGKLSFEDVTEHAGLSGHGFSMGAAVADFNNDGSADLFVAGVKANHLYRNRGDGTFEDVTQAAGIGSLEWSVGGAWIDYDRDGWLDLFVVNYLDWAPEREPYCGDPEKNLRVYCHPKNYKGTANRLYRNLGNGRFEDVSESTGIASSLGKGMSAAIGDYDQDGWMDIFVANDQQPNFLFRNTGKGRFEEVALSAGVALLEQGTPVSSMGSDLRDYDNDGAPDLIVTALAGEMFPLFRNQKQGTFHDRTFASRIGLLSDNVSGWSVGLVDLNNDGWKDIFSANSHVTDNIGAFSRYEYKLPNNVFVNQGNGEFLASKASLPVRAAHRGAAFADFDQDGRIDVVVSALGGKAELWHNEGTVRNWIGIRLRGTTSNRDGIGAVIQASGQTNGMTTAVGYASSSRDAVHFGLGDAKSVPEIRITWPGGRVQVIRNVQSNQILQVTEPEGR